MRIRHLLALIFWVSTTVFILSTFVDALFAQGTTITTRVSVASNGTQGNIDATASSISADGRYVVFVSLAANLVNNDTNNAYDVFIHDTQTVQTTRISVNSNGIQGNGNSWNPSVSADGRYVAYSSEATNLVDNDLNFSQDIFVYDTQTRQTSRVSNASNGMSGNRDSWYPSISANGGYVAFYSDATNLVSGDTNGTLDVFVHDRETGQTSRVSVNSNSVQGNQESFLPSISANGNYVAFRSYADNLVSNDTNGVQDIFVHDRQTAQTTRISVSSDGTQGNGISWIPSISADGRYVAFVSFATNLVVNDINNNSDIFVHDRQTSQTFLVSVATNGAQGNGYTHFPSSSRQISDDGRFVSFLSEANNLVSGDTNAAQDVFVHDRQTGQTSRVSVNSDGGQGNGSSESSSISGDGRYVGFSSTANNLVSGDTNNAIDTFIHDRGEGLGSTYSISGWVTDVNDNPIDGVTISTSEGHIATTNSNGSYTLNGLSTGTYILTPSKIGFTFSPNSFSVKVPNGKNFKGYDKPPLVFVHGWSGFPPWQSCEWPDPKTYFESVDDYLGDSGYYVAYAELETSSCYTPPLVENLPRLQNAILEAKSATNQPKVILIAHSMGGLVSRAYIERKNYIGDVDALYTFGSPHHGVPSDLLTFFANGTSLGYYCEHNQPAVCNFSEFGMTLFNNDYSPRTDEVDYHFISGDTPFFSRNALGQITDVLINGIIGPDDGITPTDSGLGFRLSGNFDRLETDENHNVFGPRSYFIRDGGESVSYTQCLKKVLIDKTNANCGTIATKSHVSQKTSNLSERTPFIFGTVSAGQTISHPIFLEGGPTLFTSQWLTGTLTVTLIDPNGQIINSVYSSNNPSIVTYDTDTNATIYYFPNATAGQWQIKLQGSTVPAGGSRYTTFVAFDSTLTLTGTTDKDQYAPDDITIISATLSGSSTNTKITATILDAKNTSHTINLSSVGGGNYQAAYPTPNVLGYAEIRLMATGISADGNPFERGRSLIFSISWENANNIYLPIILK